MKDITNSMPLTQITDANGNSLHLDPSSCDLDPSSCALDTDGPGRDPMRPNLDPGLDGTKFKDSSMAMLEEDIELADAIDQLDGLLLKDGDDYDRELEEFGPGGKRTSASISQNATDTAEEEVPRRRLRSSNALPPPSPISQSQHSLGRNEVFLGSSNGTNARPPPSTLRQTQLSLGGNEVFLGSQNGTNTRPPPSTLRQTQLSLGGNEVFLGSQNGTNARPPPSTLRQTQLSLGGNEVFLGSQNGTHVRSPPSTVSQSPGRNEVYLGSSYATNNQSPPSTAAQSQLGRKKMLLDTNCNQTHAQHYTFSGASTRSFTQVRSPPRSDLSSEVESDGAYVERSNKEREINKIMNNLIAGSEHLSKSPVYSPESVSEGRERDWFESGKTSGPPSLGYSSASSFPVGPPISSAYRNRPLPDHTPSSDYEKRPLQDMAISSAYGHVSVLKGPPISNTTETSRPTEMLQQRQQFEVQGPPDSGFSNPRVTGPPSDAIQELSPLSLPSKDSGLSGSNSSISSSGSDKPTKAVPPRIVPGSVTASGELHSPGVGSPPGYTITGNPDAHSPQEHIVGTGSITSPGDGSPIGYALTRSTGMNSQRPGTAASFSDVHSLGVCSPPQHTRTRTTSTHSNESRDSGSVMLEGSPMAPGNSPLPMRTTMTQQPTSPEIMFTPSPEGDCASLPGSFLPSELERVYATLSSPSSTQSGSPFAHTMAGSPSDSRSLPPPQQMFSSFGRVTSLPGVMTSPFSTQIQSGHLFTQNKTASSSELRSLPPSNISSLGVVSSPSSTQSQNRSGYTFAQNMAASPSEPRSLYPLQQSFSSPQQVRSPVGVRSPTSNAQGGVFVTPQHTNSPGQTRNLPGVKSPPSTIQGGISPSPQHLTSPAQVLSPPSNPPSFSSSHSEQLISSPEQNMRFSPAHLHSTRNVNPLTPGQSPVAHVIATSPEQTLRSSPAHLQSPRNVNLLTPGQSPATAQVNVTSPVRQAERSPASSLGSPAQVDMMSPRQETILSHSQISGGNINNTQQGIISVRDSAANAQKFRQNSLRNYEPVSTSSPSEVFYHTPPGQNPTQNNPSLSPSSSNSFQVPSHQVPLRSQPQNVRETCETQPHNSSPVQNETNSPHSFPSPSQISLQRKISHPERKILPPGDDSCQGSDPDLVCRSPGLRSGSPGFFFSQNCLLPPEALELVCDENGMWTKDDDGDTFLHALSAWENEEIAIRNLYLVKDRPNFETKINDYNNSLETPVFNAVCYGKVRLVEALLRLGADVNKMCRPVNQTTCLHYAVEQRNVRMVDILLRCSYIDVDIQRPFDGCTPLMTALKTHNPWSQRDNLLEILGLLIQREDKPNFNVRDSCSGKTMMICVVETKDVRVLDLILDNVGVDGARQLINITSRGGDSAVHVAAGLRNEVVKEEMLRKLIKCGGETNKKNHEGLTPRDWAKNVIEKVAVLR